MYPTDENGRKQDILHEMKTLGDRSCPYRPSFNLFSKLTDRQTDKEVCLRANGAKEGTRKRNFSLSLQTSSLSPLSRSLSQPDLQTRLEVHTKTAETLLKHKVEHFLTVR